MFPSFYLGAATAPDLLGGGIGCRLRTGALLSEDACFREGYRALDEQRASLVAWGTAIRESVESYGKVLRRHLGRVREIGGIRSATAKTLTLYVSCVRWWGRLRVVDPTVL